MNTETKQFLVKKLSKASNATHPVAIEHKGQVVAVVLPPADYQQHQVEQKRKLESLKTELNAIKMLVRCRLKHQSPAELEARLAEHQQKIKQELESID